MRDEAKSFWSLVGDAHSVGIIINYNWFGDSVAAALALAMAIGQRGQAVEILASPSQRGQIFRFLPGFADIKHDLTIKPEYAITVKLGQAEMGKARLEQNKQEVRFIIQLTKGALEQQPIQIEQAGWPYDLIITVGCPDKDSLGQFVTQHPNLFFQVPIINLDNNFANENFGQLNLVDIKAAAVSEIASRLIHEVNAEPGAEIATCLLTGLVAQTKNFKSPIVTPGTLALAGQLIQQGADRELIINKLYRDRSLKLLKLWGLILAKLNTAADQKLLWSTISHEQWQAAGASQDSLVALIEELVAGIPETAVFCLFIGQEQSADCLVYGIKNIDTLYLTKPLEPNGSKKLAVFHIDENAATAASAAIPLMEERLKKIVDN
ncbi:MAG: hypothetical protein WCO55_04800 [Candidatus Falkowbacteria bacterium]